MHFDEQVVSNRSTLSADAQELLPVLSAYSLTIPEGGTGSYSVALGSQPDGDVVVTLRISPSDHLTASAEQLTFTPENWDSPQTVTLTAGMDDDDLNFWLELTRLSPMHVQDLDSKLWEDGMAPKGVQAVYNERDTPTLRHGVCGISMLRRCWISGQTTPLREGVWAIRVLKSPWRFTPTHWRV